MKIDIHIPTRKRPERLNDCLISVQCAMIEGINVYVWFDTAEESDEFRLMYNWVNLWWLHFRVMDAVFIPPLFWNSRLRETTADVFMYLCDDVEMDIKCIREVRKAFVARFPDYDGVVGIRQSNLPTIQTVPAAFGGIGSKFADRFPGRNVFCPDHRVFYIDMELGKFADSIGRFYFCESAFVQHHTPGSGAVTDETNRWIRRFKKYDIATNKERERQGLLWGKDFKLVGKEV